MDKQHSSNTTDGTDLPLYRMASSQISAYRGLRAIVHAYIDTHALRISEWILLGILSDTPQGCRINMLARQLGVEAPLVSRQVHGLARRGLIREIPASDDRRAKLIEILPAGGELYRAVSNGLAVCLRPLQAGMSPEDIHVYFRVLERLTYNCAMFDRGTL